MSFSVYVFSSYRKTRYFDILVSETFAKRKLRQAREEIWSMRVASIRYNLSIDINVRCDRARVYVH